MRFTFTLALSLLLLVVLTPGSVFAAAGLADRVDAIFTSVYGRKPTPAEHTLWKSRVVKGEKKTEKELRGAMQYQKDNAGKAKTTPSTKKVSTTDKQTLIKEVLPLFISIYGNNPTEAEKAWWRKRISCDELKSLDQITASMKLHKAKKVRQGSPSICGNVIAKAGTASGVLRRAIAGVSDHVMGDTVRIGIFHTDGDAIDITADKPFQIREGANKVLGKVGAQDIVSVSWSGGKYHVRGSGLEFDVENKIRLIPEEQGIMQIKNYRDLSATYPGKNYNRFRGVIEIRKCDNCSELWAINELRIEYYLRGLAETSGNGPEEYLKSLGIAARTYALYHKIVTGGRSLYRGYDIDNTPNDQIYRGYEFEIITPRFSEILNQTKGIVVTDGEGDKLVPAVYFSDSDGRTRSAKEVWNTTNSRFSHLQSVEDPYHSASRCVGHCVGMSAQGAYGFAARENWNFQKILGYFYQGIKLVKAY